MEKWLHKIHLPNWLVGLLALVLLLRIPSFFEPYYYGDEMIYLSVGQGIRNGLTLYSQIFDNKPPFLYLVAAMAGNLFWFKVILAFWSGLTIVVFWRLAEKLFVNGAKVATLIFALATTLPLFEGNIANAELFMIGLSLLAFFLLVDQKINLKKIYFAGILFGFSTLFKVPAVLDAGVVVLYWLIAYPIKVKEFVKKVLILGVGILTPIFISFVWFYFAGALKEYFTVAFLQNLGYLESLKPTISVPIYLRAAIVLVGVIILYLNRKKLSNKFVLFSIWTLVSLFAATLSQRPYPHYLVQAIAPAALLLSMFFNDKTKEQVFSVIPLALIFFVPFFYHYYHYKTIPYYSNFIKFTLSQSDKESYFNSFSNKVNRDYEIAKFISQSSMPNDTVFVWDPNSPAIHSLSRRLPPIRFTVPYHVSDYSNKSDVAENIKKSLPKFIVLTSFDDYPEMVNLVESRYILISQIEDANIYSRIEGTSI